MYIYICIYIYIYVYIYVYIEVEKDNEIATCTAVADIVSVPTGGSISRSDSCARRKIIDPSNYKIVAGPMKLNVGSKKTVDATSVPP